MLHAYWLKGVADIRSRPWTTALLLVVVASTAALPTIALSVNRITDDAYQRTLEEANGAHVWLFHRDEARLEEAARADGVTESSGPFLRTEGGYASAEGTFALHLWGMPAERPGVATTNLTEGRWLAPGADDEVVIEAGFADRARLRPGDVIEVTGGDGQTAALRVVGIGVNTTKAPFPIEGDVDVFVASQVAEQFASDDQRQRSYAMGVRLEDPARTGEFARQIGAGGIGTPEQQPISVNSWQEISADIDENNLAVLILLSTFTVFAVLAAGFILANTVAGHVLAQRRDIGILKAVGMTPGEVTRLMLLEYLALGLLAGVVGIGAGAWGAPILVGRGARLLHADAEPVIDPGAWAIILVGVLLIVLVVTLLPALRAGRMSTLSALSPAVDGARRAALGRVAGRLRLPLPVTVALKDAFARPGRAWLTVAALTLGVATAMATLTTEATLNSMASDPRLIGEPNHELVVDPSGYVGVLHASEETGVAITHEELAALLDADESIEAWGRRLFIPSEASGRPGFIAGRALEGNPEALGYTVTDGRFYSAPGEAVIGLGLARNLGLGPGDTLQLGVIGDRGRDGRLVIEATLDLRVVGTFAENDEGGDVAMFSFETLRQAVPDPANGVYVVNLRDGTDPKQAAYRIVQYTDGRVSVEDARDDFENGISDLRTQLRAVMWPLSGTLLVIATVNLLATLLFAIREQSRDLAILKTIGFTPRQLTVSVVAGAACFMLIALAVGAPTGYFAMSRIVEYFAGEEGWPAGVTAVPEPLWLVAMVLASFLVAVIGSALPAREVVRTSASETLRAD